MTEAIEPIALGLIGLGSWARTAYVPLLRERADVEVRAVAARTEATRRLAGELFGPRTELYDDYTELLTRAEVDAVMIGLRPSISVEAATAALNAARHVWVEPPFRDDGATRRLFELAASGERVFHADLELRYLPVVDALRGLVSAGRLGRLLLVRVELRCDWARQGVIKEPDQGSTVFGVGTWYVDVLDAIVGERPERVGVIGSYPTTDSYMEVGTASLQYPTGTVGEWAFNLRSGHELELRLELVGAEGQAEADLMAGTYRHRAVEGDWQSAAADCSRPAHGFVGMRECVAGFLDAVRAGRHSRSGPTTYARLHATLAALRQSELGGTTVALK